MGSLRAFCRFAAVAEVVGPESVLTAAERSRRDRLVTPEDRAAYIAAHLLVRDCAAQLLGVAAADVELRQRCGRCGSEEHGAPYVPGSLLPLHVSLSHSRGYVAAVASRVPCGIDIEVVHRGDPPAASLSAREVAWVNAQPAQGDAFTRLWTRKEALVKAGVAELADLAQLDVLGDDGPADRIAGLVLQEWSDGLAVGACALGVC